MIACLRTVVIPEAQRARYLEWIGQGRAVRQARDPGRARSRTLRRRRRHRRADRLAQPRRVRRLDRDPERHALTASGVHQSVDYQTITRYDVVGG